uniref:Uncharacterized protein n=1 Tax=Opuntia streptacantha TaxID=393608 RepID=A0A7C9DVA4_OPUST
MLTTEVATGKWRYGIPSYFWYKECNWSGNKQMVIWCPKLLLASAITLYAADAQYHKCFPKFVHIKQKQSFNNLILLQSIGISHVNFWSAQLLQHPWKCFISLLRMY